MTGFVYVMSNPSISRGLLKIGKSDRDPKKFRANELRTTGVPEPFVVEFLALVEDADALESAVHNFLSQYRNTSDREFFSCSVPKAIDAIRSVGGMDIKHEEIFYKAPEEIERERLLRESAKKEAARRDAKLNELERKSISWADRENAKREKHRETLLVDYHDKKGGYIVGAVIIGAMAFGGGPIIGIPVGILILWGFFHWKGKIFEAAEKELDKKYPYRSSNDYPNFLLSESQIHASYEKAISQMKTRGAATAEQQPKAEAVGPQTQTKTNKPAVKDITDHGVLSEKNAAREKPAVDTSADLQKSAADIQYDKLVRNKAAFDSEQKELRQTQSRQDFAEKKGTELRKKTQNEAEAVRKSLEFKATKARTKIDVYQANVFLKGEVARFTDYPSGEQKEVSAANEELSQKADRAYPFGEQKAVSAANEELCQKANRAARRKKIRNQTKIDDCEQLIERLSRAAIIGHYSAEFLHLEKILHQTSEIKSSCANCNGVHNHYYSIGGKSLRCGLCGHERVF
jgi:hypothetical protein